MIEIISIGLDDRVIGLRVSGPIERADMDLSRAALEDRLRRHPRVRVYVEVLDLGGIAPSALLEDLRLALRHLGDVEREAVVTDAGWLGLLARAGNLLPGIEVRHFPWLEKEQALAWVQGEPWPPVAAAGNGHAAYAAPAVTDAPHRAGDPMHELHDAHVGVLVEDLFEDLELWYPVIRLREAGARVTLLGTGADSYRGKHGLTATADARTGAADPAHLDGLVIPGGYAPDRLRRHEAVLTLTREMTRLDKVVAFICHGGWVPISARIVGGRRVTSAAAIRDDLTNAGAHWEDSAVVVDGRLISSRDPGDLPAFCRAIIAGLLAVRGRGVPGQATHTGFP